MATENTQSGKYPVVRPTEGAGRPYEDITGHRFGRLTVIERCRSTPGRGGKPRWKCRCDCSSEVLLPGARLKSGSVKSCGCFRRDRAGALYRTHGKSKTPAYTMFYDARKRAAKLGLPFNIEPSDISVPDLCPVLGIQLGTGARDNAPSLDRVIPALGYVVGNIRVISFRANRIKSDATPAEIRRVLAYCKGEI